MKAVLGIVAMLITGCAVKHSEAEQSAFDRALSATRTALNYPDASAWPSIDDARFTQRGDTLTVMFTVMASNGFGVKSSEMTLLDFKVDSCVHLVNGFVAGGERPEPDPEDRPCNPAALSKWEKDRWNDYEAKHQAYMDSVQSVIDSLGQH